MCTFVPIEQRLSASLTIFCPKHQSQKIIHGFRCNICNGSNFVQLHLWLFQYANEKPQNEAGVGTLEAALWVRFGRSPTQILACESLHQR